MGPGKQGHAQLIIGKYTFTELEVGSSFILYIHSACFLLFLYYVSIMAEMVRNTGAYNLKRIIDFNVFFSSKIVI